MCGAEDLNVCHGEKNPAGKGRRGSWEATERGMESRVLKGAGGASWGARSPSPPTAPRGGRPRHCSLSSLAFATQDVPANTRDAVTSPGGHGSALHAVLALAPCPASVLFVNIGKVGSPRLPLYSCLHLGSSIPFF